MARNSVIRQVLAGVLLFIFSFSITPKQFLHDAIANHKDKEATLLPGGAPQLTHAGFICKCDNLVAESPFTNDLPLFVIAAIPEFSVQQSLPLYHYFSSSVFFFELRGPPASQA